MNYGHFWKGQFNSSIVTDPVLLMHLPVSLSTIHSAVAQGPDLSAKLLMGNWPSSSLQSMTSEPWASYLCTLMVLSILVMQNRLCSVQDTTSGVTTLATTWSRLQIYGKVQSMMLAALVGMMLLQIQYNMHNGHVNASFNVQYTEQIIFRLDRIFTMRGNNCKYIKM